MIPDTLGEDRSSADASPSRVADGDVLDPVVGPQCSLAVQLRRASGGVIGRSAELGAISQELEEASARLSAVTLEGDLGGAVRAERRAWRDLAGAGRSDRPTVRGDPRGRARHRQDPPAARRGRAGVGGRVHLRRDHGRRGDPRAVPPRPEPVRVGRDPGHGRGNTGGSGRPARGRGDLGARRTRVREPVARCEAPEGIRSRGRCDRDALEDPADRAPHRRRPVGRRRHAPAPAVRRPERLGPADLPVHDDPTRRVRHGHRGRQLRRRHGTDGSRPTDATRPIRSPRNCRAPEAGARGPGRSLVCGGDACPIRGRSVHRRGAGADPPRGGNAPAGGRRVAPRPQRGPARPLSGPDPHRPSCRTTPGPDQGCARRRGDPRPKLQPSRPSRDPRARGRRRHLLGSGRGRPSDGPGPGR